MSNRYYSPPARQAISIRLILILIIPLLIVMLSWLYFNRGQNSSGSDKDQASVQELNIPRQHGIKIEEIDDTVETKKVTDSVQINKETTPKSDIEQEKNNSGAKVIQTAKVRLPTLAESDAVFRQDVMNLSSEFFILVNTEDIISHWMVAINDFSQNLRPYKHFRYFKLTEPFQISSDVSGDYIAQQSYKRYDALARAINAVDINKVLDLLTKYRPLLRQVFLKFNYPEHYQLDDIIKTAASNVLQAPVIEDKVLVKKAALRYKFADKKLENLSPVKKQMIRMGPENTRIIQAKLRQFVQELANR